MPIAFSTKARTLAELQGQIASARIALLAYFTVAEWRHDRAACLARVRRILGDGLLIVRSSCQREDGANKSNAGAFLSLPNVSKEHFENAVDRVIASYGEAQPGDEVLVQPMLRNVVRSGVAFSHDPNTSAAYRVVNWSEGDDVTFVTGGRGGRIWQQAAASPVAPPRELAGVLDLIDELLSLFGGLPLDCEFAVTLEEAGEVLWLLQARPLFLPRAPESASQQAARLQQVHDKVARGILPHPFLMGSRTVYGVMPDWNPAEIIGVRPKPLALSLYRELITDAIWAYQRHNYGYRNLRSSPLMLHFFGLPYIDVRVSFNSFIPGDLEEGIAKRLVDYYIDRLLAEPTLHDKVEFEIVFSCYTLDLPERLERLADAGFAKEERERSLPTAYAGLPTASCIPRMACGAKMRPSSKPLMRGAKNCSPPTPTHLSESTGCSKTPSVMAHCRLRGSRAPALWRCRCCDHSWPWECSPKQIMMPSWLGSRRLVVNWPVIAPC